MLNAVEAQTRTMKPTRFEDLRFQYLYCSSANSFGLCCVFVDSVPAIEHGSWLLRFASEKYIERKWKGGELRQHVQPRGLFRLPS